MGIKLTLGENQRIGLNEVLEGGLGQSLDIRSTLSLGKGGEGGQLASNELLVLHDVLDVCLKENKKLETLQRDNFFQYYGQEAGKENQEVLRG